jgi:hypothetical protein
MEIHCSTKFLWAPNAISCYESSVHAAAEMQSLPGQRKIALKVYPQHLEDGGLLLSTSYCRTTQFLFYHAFPSPSHHDAGVASDTLSKLVSRTSTYGA